MSSIVLLNKTTPIKFQQIPEQFLNQLNLLSPQGNEFKAANCTPCPPVLHCPLTLLTAMHTYRAIDYRMYSKFRDNASLGHAVSSFPLLSSHS